MIGDYSFVRKLTEGVVTLQHWEHGNQIWTKVNTRKETKCAQCGAPIEKKVAAFSPLTNSNNRWHRICRACIERKCS